MFNIGGITIHVDADFLITDNIFHPKFQKFRTMDGGEDIIRLTHHFYLPVLDERKLGDIVYSQVPWKIYKNNKNWTYLEIGPKALEGAILSVSLFSNNYTIGEIHTQSPKFFILGNHTSLTLFPTDQILLAPVLADRQGCIMHSAGMIIDDQGLLFVGHSEAGKSTIVTQLQQYGEILCDDRMIVRRWPEGFRIHGTWSHGDVPIVSPASAPLRAILLLEQAPENQLIPIQDLREIVRRLPFFVVKPLVTAEWWEKTLDVIERMAYEVPVYRLRFDKSGQVIKVIRSLL